MGRSGEDLGRSLGSFWGLGVVLEALGMSLDPSLKVLGRTWEGKMELISIQNRTTNSQNAQIFHENSCMFITFVKHFVKFITAPLGARGPWAPNIMNFGPWVKPPGWVTSASTPAN